MLIVNADDLGRSAAETDAVLSFYNEGRITSASAMVFMKDSERAAELARDSGLDVGLHLNLSECFTGNGYSSRIQARHNRIISFLRHDKYSHLLYNPFLRRSISEVYQAQIDEFRRLYRKQPSHVDGHHHMHLCANVIIGKLIPPGVKLRRHFSFWPGEKGLLNRTYRRLVDRWLARQHRMPDYFFCLLQCIQQGKWNRVEALARSSTVELMTHPIVAAEAEYLKGGEFHALLQRVQSGTYASL
ncbi:MAG: ChbG/HpnK family deacetylase [Limisphaerales bacterium]